MTLAGAFTELSEKVGHLERTLDNLLWAVVQGQPETQEGHAPLDHYEEVTSDLLGIVREAKEAAAEGQHATQGQLDLVRTRQALSRCQERCNQLSGRIYADLISLDWFEALNNLAHERGGEWAKWVLGVKDALDRGPQTFHDVAQALFLCWQELTERASGLSATASGNSPQRQRRGGRKGPNAGQRKVKTESCPNV